MITKLLRTTLLLLVILFILLISFVLSTKGGSHMIFDLICSQNNAKGFVVGLQGNLLEGLSAKRITYHSALHHFEVDNFKFRWKPWRVFNRTIDITKLDASKVIYTNLTKHNSSEEIAVDKRVQAFNLPFLSLVIRNASIHHVVIQPQRNRKPFKLSSLQIKSTHYKSMWSIDSTWHSLTVPLDKAHTLLINSGQCHITGKAAKYTFKGDTRLSGKHMPEGNLHFAGDGTIDTLRFSSLKLSSHAGQLHSTGTFNWEKNLNWQVEADINKFNLASLTPSVSSKLYAKLSLSGDLKDGEITNKVHVYSLHGVLNKQKIQASFNLTQVNTVIENAAINLQLGHNKTKLVMNSGLKDNAIWQINLPTLSSFWPTWHGSFSSNGHASIAKGKLNLSANMNAHRLSAPGFSLASAKATANLEGEHPTRNVGQLSISNLHIGPHSLKQANLVATGSLHDSFIALNAILPFTRVNAQLNTVYDAKKSDLTTTLHKLTLIATLPKIAEPKWVLKAPASWHVDFKTGQLSASDTCLDNTYGHICLSGDYFTNDRWQIALMTKHLSARYLAPLTENKLLLDSYLTLNGNLIRERTGLTGKADIGVSKGTLTITTFGKKHLYGVKNGMAQISLNNKQALATGNLSLEEKQFIHYHLRLPNFKLFSKLNPSQTISSRLTAHLTDVKLVKTWFPDIGKIQGALDINLTSRGKLESPLLKGQAKLSIDSLNIPTLGLVLEKSFIALNANAKHFAKLSGQLNSSHGSLTIAGDYTTSQFIPHVEVDVTGNNFTAINTPSYVIHLSPTIHAGVSPGAATVSGKVVVPYVRIEGNNLSVAGNNLPDDVVFASTLKRHRFRSSFKLSGKLQTILGDDVKINTHGLTGRLTGSLLIHKEDSKATLANGTLSLVDGSYEAYGKKLNIKQGALIYTGGPINNPGINVVAVKKFDDVNLSNTLSTGSANINIGSQLQQLPNITQTKVRLPGQANDLLVGLQILGTINNPQVSLFAEPAILSQGDILSYLLFGRSVSSLSSSSGGSNTVANASTLLQIASSLNISAASISNISQEIQHSLGFDELGVETTTLPSGYAAESKTGNINTNTSLVIGKRLSKRFYVNYSLGLVEPINILRIKYLIGRKWTLQAQNSQESTGVDLFYTFEK